MDLFIFFFFFFPLKTKLSGVCVGCGGGVGKDACVRDIHDTGTVGVPTYINISLSECEQ